MPFDHDDQKHIQIQVQDVDVAYQNEARKSGVVRGRHYRGVRQRPWGFVVEKRDSTKNGAKVLAQDLRDL